VLEIESSRGDGATWTHKTAPWMVIGEAAGAFGVGEIKVRASFTDFPGSV